MYWVSFVCLYNLQSLLVQKYEEVLQGEGAGWWGEILALHPYLKSTAMVVHFTDENPILLMKKQGLKVTEQEM